MIELNETDWLRNDAKKITTVATITTSFLVLFLSLIGNFLVVAVFYRNKTLRTPVHYFIVNMAISDLIFPVVVLPLEIAKNCYGGQWMVNGVIGTLLCKLRMVAFSIFTNVSILSMVSIAVDRFHAILFAMRPPLISRKTCLLVIVIMWIISTAFQASIIYGYRVIRKDKEIYCEFQWEPVSHTRKVKQVNGVMFFVLFAMSAVVLTVLYSSIVRALHKQKSSIHMASEIVKCRAKENRKVTCMLVLVVMFYVVWIPYYVRVFLLYFRRDYELPSSFSFIAAALPTLYTLINPGVYFLFNENITEVSKNCCVVYGPVITSAVTRQLHLSVKMLPKTKRR